MPACSNGGFYKFQAHPRQFSRSPCLCWGSRRQGLRAQHDGQDVPPQFHQNSIFTLGPRSVSAPLCFSLPSPYLSGSGGYDISATAISMAVTSCSLVNDGSSFRDSEQRIPEKEAEDGEHPSSLPDSTLWQHNRQVPRQRYHDHPGQRLDGGAAEEMGLGLYGDATRMTSELRGQHAKISRLIDSGD